MPDVRLATLADYQWLYAHGYMQDGMKCARDILLDIVERCPATFLDFGCGRGQLVDWINAKTAGGAYGYDPGIGREDPWRGARDWFVSCDVLEHLREDQIQPLFAQVGRSVNRGALLTIANMSDVHLVDGMPVELHLIQQPASWWMDRIHETLPTALIQYRRIDSQRFTLIVEFA